MMSFLLTLDGGKYAASLTALQKNSSLAEWKDFLL